MGINMIKYNGHDLDNKKLIISIDFCISLYIN